MWNAVSMLAVVVSMIAVALFVWKRVNIGEQGDHELEAKLKADDERAEDGRRRRWGLPPIDRSKPQGSAQPPKDAGEPH